MELVDNLRHGIGESTSIPSVIVDLGDRPIGSV